MTTPSPQLRVTVVGDGSVLDSPAVDRRVSVSTAEAAAFAPQAVNSDGQADGDSSEADRLAEADCLVVDRPTADAWRAVVERVANHRPSLPVVVFFEESAAVGEAIAAGADDYLPRSLADRRPSLVVDRLAAVADSGDSGATADSEASSGGEKSTPEGGEPPSETVEPSPETVEPSTQPSRERFESVADGLVVHDPETGEIRDCNAAFCAQTGYDRAELIGEPVDRVVATGEGYGYAEARDRICRASERGPQLFEWRGRRKSGETYPVEVSLRQATIGGHERVVASVRDITERREKEQRLAAIRDQRSTLFENSPDPIVAVTRVDDRPQVTDVNPAFESTFGFEAERVVGEPLSSVIVPEDRQDRYEGLRDRALGGEPIEAEVRRETADGMRDFLLRVLAFETDIDDHAYVWYTDITERRERERALERERDRRSVLFENNPDPVAGIEFDGDRALIREVNPAFESTFGFAAEGVVGEPVAETVVPEGKREGYDRLRRRAAAGEAIEGEAPRLTADGQRRFVFRVIQFNDDPGTTDAYVWYTDVTDRRRHERAVESLQAATGRMQRAESADAIAEIAVEAATEALELPMAVCWLHDDDRRRLDPVAATEGADEALQQPIDAGSELYDRFETDEITRCRPADGAAIEGLLLPLGDRGLLAVDGADDDVIRDVVGTLAEQTETALRRVDRSRAVRESERRLQAILDRIDEAIFLGPVPELDAADPNPDFVSSGYEAIWGLSLEAIHARYDEGFFETVHDDDYDGYRAFVRHLMAEVEGGDPADTYSHEYRIRRPDGGIRWIHSDFYPIDWTDGPQRMVIVSRDITDRKQRHRTLESFHDATAELTTADTVDAASRLGVEAAASVFELPATAVYHYEESTARLTPRATGPDLPPPAELSPLSSDHRRVWEAFIGEGMARIDAGDEPVLAVGPGDELLVFPLGRNGLLAVWRAGDAFDTDAASILAATLEAALNRLRGERQLESRQRELDAQTERAERLDAVAELTQRVEAAITTTSSREGIQEAVCEELVDVEPFAGAWIAAAEVGADRLTPRAADGVDRDHAEQLLGGEQSDTDPHPAVDAWRSGESRVVNDLVGSGRASGWREQLLKAGVGSVCAVPLTYSGITYGVVTIRADEPGAFGDREMDVLAQLSRSIGYAITAVERRRALESDDTVELEFTGNEMALPFADLARETGCQVRHERTVRRQDGSVSVYYSLRGTVPEAVASTAADVLPGEVAVVSQQDGEAVVERQGSSWFGSLISEYGGVLRQGVATTGGVTLLVELPREADVRTIVDRLRTAFPSLELAAKRQHRETAATPREARSRLQRALTDRQHEALQTAHAMGYFEWPRDNSGEEVADALGITQPTVNKHIRLGERKVFDFFFGSNGE